MEKLRNIAFIKIGYNEVILKTTTGLSNIIIEYNNYSYTGLLERIINNLMNMEIDLIVAEDIGLQKLFIKSLSEAINNKNLKINVLESKYPLFKII